MSIFNIGDLVRIRQWDDMASQYRESAGTIRCRCGFNKEMKRLCGKEFVVEATGRHIVMGHGTPFLISDDMLELVRDDTIEETEEMERYLRQIRVME